MNEFAVKDILPVYERDLNVRLHGPGPSNVHNNVLNAMASPTIGHLDSEFIKIMDETSAMLRAVYQTENTVTLPLPVPGSGGMDALVANVLGKNGIALVVKNGEFGKRIEESIMKRGAFAETIEIDWGKTVTPDDVRDALDGGNLMDAVFVVHAETSTGALQPYMREIGEVVHEYNSLFLVDCVTSLGGVSVPIDDWKVDAAYSGTQKCLSVSPGMSPITINDKVMDLVRDHKNDISSWLLDLNKLTEYWKEAGKRAYHHTAPINAVYGLHEGLRMILEEGLENVYERHKRNGQALQAGLEAMGFKYIVEKPEERLPMLHAVYYPDGVKDEPFRTQLKEEHSIEIGAGLGQFAGKAGRIGILGNGSRGENILYLVGAIGTELKKGSIISDKNIGVDAASEILN